MNYLLIGAAVILSVACLSETQEKEQKCAESFEFPDEWERHEGTILTFPTRRAYGREAKAFQDEFAALVKAIVENEPVLVFAHPDDEKRAKAILDPRAKLTFDQVFRVDWARDTAPLIVRNGVGARRAVCFQFNSWGKKFPGWKENVGMARAMAEHMKLPIVESGLVLEGGAVEIGSTKSGRTGITTEQCVLNRNRSDWPRAKIEAELKSRLGLERIIWLKKGLNPDPITDGHVDGLVKFVARNKVLLHTTDDEKDLNYKSCLEAKKILEKAGLEVIELPLARDMVHMNFYIGSEGKVAYVPVCGDEKQDEPALTIIRKHFKKVVPIIANEIAKQGGGVHCLTQQIPQGKSAGTK